MRIRHFRPNELILCFRGGKSRRDGGKESRRGAGSLRPWMPDYDTDIDCWEDENPLSAPKIIHLKTFRSSEVRVRKLSLLQQPEKPLIKYGLDVCTQFRILNKECVLTLM
jgi:hypothetical protein